MLSPLPPSPIPVVVLISHMTSLHFHCCLLQPVLNIIIKVIWSCQSCVEYPSEPPNLLSIELVSWQHRLCLHIVQPHTLSVTLCFQLSCTPCSICAHLLPPPGDEELLPQGLFTYLSLCLETSFLQLVHFLTYTDFHS